eukprot:scaffold24157_cov18-Tisochrysis_lutea.AAC.4
MALHRQHCMDVRLQELDIGSGSRQALYKDADSLRLQMLAPLKKLLLPLKKPNGCAPLYLGHVSFLSLSKDCPLHAALYLHLLGVRKQHRKSVAREVAELANENDRIGALDNIPPAIRRANPNITRDYYLRMRSQ